MARVNRFTLRRIERPSKHQSIEASYSIVEIDGERLLQIDTFGSATRQIPGKVSQSLQFGPEGIQALREILEQLD